MTPLPKSPVRLAPSSFHGFTSAPVALMAAVSSPDGRPRLATSSSSYFPGSTWGWYPKAPPENEALGWIEAAA